MGDSQIQQIREREVNDTQERVPTGIPGLDELCEGGFERNSTVLVMGSAGSGKSMLLSQFIYSGATFYNEPGIILSLGEQAEQIRSHCMKFGWDLKSLEEEEKLAVLNYKPQEVRKLSEEGGGLIWDTISEIGARRISIDSLSSYVGLFADVHQAREAQIVLFDMVRKWKCTTLFSAESAEGNIHTGLGMEYLADAVLALSHPKRENTRYRSLEILKMRGTNHSNKTCPFEILPQDGLVTYPGEDLFEGI